MAGHDIIVIGSSAGGVELLVQLARDLPADLPAAIFVVQHLPSGSASLLPELLSRVGPLPAAHPADGEVIEPGRIYIAPSDEHMLIEPGHVHIIRGPKENGFRPAIDATFRTAARAYGPRVVGVVLTGMLDDGTAGLLAIKQRGGLALVQAPAEAPFPSMPVSAIRYVDVDAVVALAELPTMLAQLASEPARAETAAPGKNGHGQGDNELATDILEMRRGALDTAADTATPAPFSCPDCGGVLAEFYEGEMLRFRCQVGHGFSQESLLSVQGERLDYQLWAAYRALDERATLARRLVADAQRLKDAASARRFAQLIAQAEQQKEHIREVLIKDEAAVGGPHPHHNGPDS